MRQLDIKEIQNKQLEMLRIVVDIFNKYNLRYYLCGGTLLGAVRHKGFIPWDDDIDLLMPRPDYDNLIEAIRSQPLLPDYEFRSYNLGNSYDPCCRLYDLDTYVERDYIDDACDKWLWIDILPMDGCPEDEHELEAMFREVMKCRKLLNLMESKVGTGKSLTKKIIKPVFKYICLTAVSKKKLADKMDAVCRRYQFEDSDTVAGIAYGYGPQERMDRKSFTLPADFEFEGMILKGPSCYEKYLQALYGNYMELPPEGERQVHFMKVYEK